MQDLINLGMQGMKASHTSMAVAGKNLNNIDTPGFNRRQAMWENKTAGVDISAIRRIYAESNLKLLQNSNSSAGKWNSYLNAAEPLNHLLAGTDNSLNREINNLFSSLNQLSNNAADLTMRDIFIQNANNLTAEFNNLYSNLQQQQRNLSDDLSTQITRANSLSSKIAELNNEIAKGATNDLLDARDQAIEELASLMEVNVVKEGSNLNVYSKCGTSIVLAGTASQINIDNHDNLSVTNNNQQLPLTKLGGAIGGLLDAKQNLLNPAVKQLGALAKQISQEFNQQLNKGLDLNGDFGGNLFADLSNLSDDEAARNFAVILTDPKKLAFANPLTTTNLNNDSKTSLNININNIGDDLNNNLPLTFKILENNQYQILNNKNEVIKTDDINNLDNLSLNDGTNINFKISDNYKVGDAFTINKNNNNSNDNSNILKLARLQDNINTNSNNIAHNIAAKTNNAENKLQTAAKLLDKYTAMRSSLSGVNNDEETSNIIKFQQFYDANATLIKTSQTCFNTLINII